MLNEIELPQDWYKIKISKRQQMCLSKIVNPLTDAIHTLYVNVHQQLCTFAPVFHLKHMNNILVNKEDLPPFLLIFAKWGTCLII